MGRLFKSEVHEQAFVNSGFTIAGGIDEFQIQALYEIYNKLQIADDIGLGYNVGMNSRIREKRIAMQRAIIETIGDTIANQLDGYKPYSATFMNKEHKKHLLIKAHQDFSYTDENQYPSFMCWIPLLDVNLQNGALGYIPSSHMHLTYPRAFPSPLQPTPVTEHQVSLMKYFNIMPMKKGEAIFFNHRTIHGSFPNVSGKERLAVGINFVKKETTPLAYIFNPQSKGAEIDLYEVDSQFITDFTNSMLHEQYQSGKIQIPYKKVNTIRWPYPDLSGGSFLEKIASLSKGSKLENEAILNNYYLHERRQKWVNRIYGIIPEFAKRIYQVK
ncbi:MAG: phytanoyl-CoA dioxygenase family protein [Chitinophagales bacterium]